MFDLVSNRGDSALSLFVRDPQLNLGREVRPWLVPFASTFVILAGTLTSVMLGAQIKECVPTCNDFVPISGVGIRCGDDDFGQPFYPVDYPCRPTVFEDPWCSTALMYISELACLAVWEVRKRIAYGEEDSDFWARKAARRPKLLWWIIPTALDMCSSVSYFHSIQLVPSSTVNIVGSFNIILTAMISAIWLRKALLVHEWMGVLLICVGLVFTSDGITEFSGPGITLAILIIAFEGCLYNSIEHLFSCYSISPWRAVGLQGVYGILVSVPAVAIAHLTHQINFSVTLYQISHSWVVAMSSVLLIITIAIFNVALQTCIKHSSCVHCVVVLALRSVWNWLLEVALGWVHCKLRVVIALSVVVLGSFIYNNVWINTMGNEFWMRPVTCKKLCCGRLREDPVMDADNSVQACL
ncbi:MAG: uncharacterized protein KVP18_003165 [Porospora cf. gigantea A]|uniref:uncharacterized protein n=1 Tax=Porospora cf. gigantea A TaxID=2853593 RepID=UPI0035599927|nr:MAG: hypothetical protein KVP18_003165 [Porospora cf. gigantea A]